MLKLEFGVEKLLRVISKKSIATQMSSVDYRVADSEGPLQRCQPVVTTKNYKNFQFSTEKVKFFYGKFLKK